MLNQALKQKTIVKTDCHESNNNTPSLKKIIGTGKGCFNTPEEADNFINNERNSWEY